MEQAVAVLSPADVGVIRRYVQTKYAPLPEAKRAEIVADAIRQTVQRRLPDVPSDLKEQIALELIRRCLVRERREIKPDDVLDVCAEIALPDPSSEALILDPLLRWMNERSADSWNPEKLLKRLLRNAASEVTLNGEAAIQLNVRVWPAWRTIMLRTAWMMPVLMLFAGIAAGVMLDRAERAKQAETVRHSPLFELPKTVADIGISAELRYRDIDAKAVRAYLDLRDSLLAEEPYFSAIVESAREFDVNPLLLFAITGQEQGFVPKSSKQAKTIANNPFNVFYSWESFNTNIYESADIAARTVSRQSRKRPEGHEPFQWLNTTYAEDPNWAVGVKLLFDKLSRLSSHPQ